MRFSSFVPFKSLMLRAVIYAGLHAKASPRGGRPNKAMPLRLPGPSHSVRPVLLPQKNTQGSLCPQLPRRANLSLTLLPTCNQTCRPSTPLASSEPTMVKKRPLFPVPPLTDVTNPLTPPSRSGMRAQPCGLPVCFSDHGVSGVLGRGLRNGGVVQRCSATTTPARMSAAPSKNRVVNVSGKNSSPKAVPSGGCI